MNISKKDKERLDVELEFLKTKLALRFTDSTKIVPDLAEPSDYYTTWHGFGFNSHRVQVDCYTCCRGNSGFNFGTSGGFPKTTGNRGVPPLYSTAELALRAMRKEVELLFAKTLREIDKQIEREIANPTPRPQDIQSNA